MEGYVACYVAKFLFLKNIITKKKSDPRANAKNLELKIDQLVYQLYDLTEKEIKIVEGGKVIDINFACFMFMSKNLTQDQVVILDKINSGRNILNRDVSSDEYESVKDLVIKRGQGGINLKINEYLLKKSKKYIDNFSNTHASQKTSKEMILDYARKNDEFSTAEAYGILSGKTKVWVRKMLMNMVVANELQRIAQGVYRIVLSEQGKQKNGTKRATTNRKEA